MSLTADFDPFAGQKLRAARRAASASAVGVLLDTRESLEQRLSTKLREPVSVCPSCGVLATGRDKIREKAAALARKAFAKPPTSNTGAITENSAKRSEVDPLIDWTTVTFRGADSLDRAKLNFGAGLDSEWVDMGRGGFGYASCLKRGQVSVYHGGNVNPDTVSVVVSGSGCRQLEAEGLIGGPDVLLRGATPWEAFLYELVDQGATFARLDVALDDRSGLLSLGTMEKSFREGDCSTRFRDMRSEVGYTSEGAVTGQTLYFGSRQSLMFVRVYHKGLEQLHKDRSQDEKEPEPWIRCEIQARDERADALVKQIIQHGMRSVASVLWSYIDFKTPESRDQFSNTSDKYKRDTSQWWMEFINRVDKSRLGVMPRVYDVEKMVAWVRRQVAPTLHVIVNSSSMGWDLVSSLVLEGGERLRNHHICALVAHNSTGQHNGKRNCSVSV